ncbi:MAG: hypothetical protein KJN95_00270 [Gammaproteobacteria bacterium]|nr:hypothetical protein [Gammaproteobacteria bacterium]MBT8436396.1 hypothetical protein [Gammaproteobacteria bacterium]
MISVDHASVLLSLAFIRENSGILDSIALNAGAGLSMQLSAGLLETEMLL